MAPERLNLKYKVTILNSPAINAFALPNGQLYVTRGLLALANDTRQLASVPSHEMAHVVARHAAIREDQAKQASLKNCVPPTRRGPANRRDGARALQIQLATFSRQQELEADGVGVGISQRAGFDLTARCVPDRDGPQRDCGAGQQWVGRMLPRSFSRRTRAPPTA